MDYNKQSRHSATNWNLFNIHSDSVDALAGC